MDFNHVDGLTAIGKKSFIAELMPRQPLYVDYLPQSAIDVIGKVHTSTQPARRLLEQEGMYYEGYVDIFDAGPVLQGRVSELRAVRDSVLAVAAEGLPAIDTGESAADAPQDSAGDTEHMLVSNTRLDDFRMILTRAVPGANSVVLSPDELALLRIDAGDNVRTLTLNTRKNTHG